MFLRNAKPIEHCDVTFQCLQSDWLHITVFEKLSSTLLFIRSRENVEFAFLDLVMISSRHFRIVEIKIFQVRSFHMKLVAECCQICRFGPR